MVRPASFDRYGMKRGAWSEEEDNKLRACINRFGHPNWRLLPLLAGLKRCGKSCRLRWVNYLKPGLRRGNFTIDEEHLIIQLHNQLGKKWSAIAAHFPGRTDNDIKNYWHAHIQKRRAKRNGNLTRAIRIQNQAKEEQSSDNNSSITTSLNQDTPASEAVFNYGLSAAENIGVFESNADSDFNSAADLYQPRCSIFDVDHHNFFEEGFYEVGFWQQENIMSILGDSSDGGIASWNLSAAMSEPDFMMTETVEEDFFNINFGDDYYEYVQL